MKGAACGRADLVRALAAGGEAWLEAAADLLGYERRADEALPSTPARVVPTSPAAASTPAAPAVALPEVIEPAASAVAVPFWRPARVRVREDAEREPAPEHKDVTWKDRPTTWPGHLPLSPLSTLLTRLRQAVCVVRVSRRVDVVRAVRLLGQGRDLARVPRVRRRRWGRALQVICDRSTRLTPYWGDQDRVLLALDRLYPAGGLDVVLCDETGDLFSTARMRRGAPYRPPPPEVRTLVLGDLGCLDLRPERAGVATWARLGRRLAAQGLAPAALLPCGLGRLAAAPPRGFRLLSHEPGSLRLAGRALQPAPALTAAAEQLLAWLAPAVRIQPELLRRARLELGRGALHAGVESIVWQHPAASTRHPLGLSLQPPEARRLRDRFAGEPEPSRRAALAVLRAFRGGALPQEIWFEEVLGLDAESQRLVPEADVEAAREYVRHETLPALLAPGNDATRLGATRWLGALGERLPRDAWQGDAARALRQSWMAARSSRWSEDPFEVDPREAPSSAGWPERRVRIVQSGANLVFVAAGAPLDRTASPLATIRVRFPRVRIERRSSFWRTGTPPPWATEWGDDDFGPWVEFEVGGVRQRLRWIPPGRFRMGSPPNEAGRFPDEGPQHDVTIGAGFWMFDTPSTQALWETVMGHNPSRFRSAERPVEQVSWEQCRRFLERLNVLVPGLDVLLPSEAQWEYACRAGTKTATYAGGNDAPTLDRIAWYEANSTGETQPVGRKSANAWGLLDMLGNVWEWVEDDWHDAYAGAPADGSAWVSSGLGSARVGRGGFWSDDARHVRAAWRGRLAPDAHYDGLGFRCVRVQDQAKPAGPREARGAEIRASAGAAGSVWVGPGGDQPQALDGARLVVVESDRETLELERLTKPAWACAIARDGYGLYAEFELPTPRGFVTQRMRWVAPGTFRMGSPPDEPGRWDREGPQHEVTLAQGFWLFDTPCTQALWEAVMGEERNRSRFRTSDRPVEQVSWEDCAEFLARVNERVPGLGLVLPSEAQWEYACRAGTETATYAGPIEIVGQNNAPVLDEIAWYGGNSGVGFELEEFENSSKWPEKQHEHRRAGTHPVARKRANGWGLYDMLGNVREWVEDDWHETYEGAPADGSAWVSSERGSARVVRGGSWYGNARNVRAACRNRDAPDDRDVNLGFRGARVQDPAEAVGPREDRSAERRSSAARLGSEGRRGTRRPGARKRV